MSGFLSAEWVEDCRRLWSAGPPGPDATVVFAVAAAPEEGYWWRLEDGRLAAAGLGPRDDPDVTFTHSRADAVGLARGELDLNAGFMQGRVKVAGDSAKLFSVLALTASPAYKALLVEVAGLRPPA